MTSGISGPGGGPPAGPIDATSGADAAAGTERAGASLAAEVERLRDTQGAAPAAGVDLPRLAADLDAGRVTGDEALAQLIAELGAGLPELDAADLRALVADLVASDPHLAALAEQLGGGGRTG
jgi:hypothetical protein